MSLCRDISQKTNADNVSKAINGKVEKVVVWAQCLIWKSKKQQHRYLQLLHLLGCFTNVFYPRFSLSIVSLKLYSYYQMNFVSIMIITNNHLDISIQNICICITTYSIRINHILTNGFHDSLVCFPHILNQFLHCYWFDVKYRYKYRLLRVSFSHCVFTFHALYIP